MSLRRSWYAGEAVDLVPNVESAAALVNAPAIARASKRGGQELAYARARFLVECRAAGVEAIDCPYTFSDVKGAAADARYAARLGYRMKSLVDPAHAAAVNKALTPDFARAQDRRGVREGARAGKGPRAARRRADRGSGLRRG